MNSLKSLYAYPRSQIVFQDSRCEFLSVCVGGGAKTVKIFSNVAQYGWVMEKNFAFQSVLKPLKLPFLLQIMNKNDYN